MSVESYTSSSTPNTVTVMTTVNGSTTEQILPTPYGVKTSIVETYIGASPSIEATTTHLTQAEVKQIQQQELASEMDMQAMQQDMDQLLTDQQKMFNTMWNNF